jgi:hypothetical protein
LEEGGVVGGLASDHAHAASSTVPVLNGGQPVLSQKIDRGIRPSVPGI